MVFLQNAIANVLLGVMFCRKLCHILQYDICVASFYWDCHCFWQIDNLDIDIFGSGVWGSGSVSLLIKWDIGIGKGSPHMSAVRTPSQRMPASFSYQEVWARSTTTLPLQMLAGVTTVYGHAGEAWTETWKKTGDAHTRTEQEFVEIVCHL